MGSPVGQLGAAWAIALKDLRHMARDKTAAFFTLGFPVIVALLFGAMFGGTDSGGSDALPIAVFVEEKDAPAPRAFMKSLDDDDAIKVREAATLAEGESLVRRGECVACLTLPKGFDPANIFGSGIAITGVVDPKRGAEAGLLTGKLNQIAFMEMSGAFTNPAKMRGMMDRARTSLGADTPAPIRSALQGLFTSVDAVSGAVDEEQKKDAGSGSGEKKSFAWEPVKVTLTKLEVGKQGPPSAFAVSFPQGVVWGLMGVVTGFAAGFAAERTRGTLLRLTMAPLSAGTLLFGKALACFVACMGVQGILVAILSLPFFKTPIANPGMLMVAMAVTSASLTGLAMLIAGLSRTEEGAGGIARGALIVLALIGGGSIPLFFMPKFMRTLSGISPFKWSTEALEGAMWRGWSIGEMLHPILILGAMGAGCFTVGVIALRRARVG